MWELWGVEISAFPLTWHIAYTTACCDTLAPMSLCMCLSVCVSVFTEVLQWLAVCLQ